MELLKIGDKVVFSEHYNFVYPKNNKQYKISKVLESKIPYKSIPDADKSNYFLAYGKLEEYPLITYHIKELDNNQEFPYLIVSQFGVVKA